MNSQKQQGQKQATEGKRRGREMPEVMKSHGQSSAGAQKEEPDSNQRHVCSPSSRPGDRGQASLHCAWLHAYHSLVV